MQTRNPAQQMQPVHVATQETIISGPLPPSSELERYEKILPGAAQRILELLENETRHRQALEKEAQNANIHAQRMQLENANSLGQHESHNVALGKLYGLIVSLCSIAGAVYVNNNWVSAALCAIPTAAIIQAFAGNFIKQKIDKEDKK